MLRCHGIDASTRGGDSPANLDSYHGGDGPAVLSDCYGNANTGLDGCLGLDASMVARHNEGGNEIGW